MVGNQAQAVDLQQDGTVVIIITTLLSSEEYLARDTSPRSEAVTEVPRS